MCYCICAWRGYHSGQALRIRAANPSYVLCRYGTAMYFTGWGLSTQKGKPAKYSEAPVALSTACIAAAGE